MKIPNLDNLIFHEDLGNFKEIVTNDEVSFNLPVNMFWGYGSLSKLEILSIISFLKMGYEVNLWTYDCIKNVPFGTVIRNANEIVSEKNIFRYKNGSLAGFANLFRYMLLKKFGGLWADTDVICFYKSYNFKISNIKSFLPAVRHPSGGFYLNNNLCYNSSPESGDIFDLALGIAERYDSSKLEWGDCGPNLLTSLVNLYPKLAPSIMSPNFSNFIDWWNSPGYFLSESNNSSEILNSLCFLHCFNEMWIRSGIDKNDPFPNGSLMYEIEKIIM